MKQSIRHVVGCQDSQLNKSCDNSRVNYTYNVDKQYSWEMWSLNSQEPTAYLTPIEKIMHY